MALPYASQDMEFALPPEKSLSLNVLVVDDNIINQQVARTLLKRLGHMGVVVGDGEKALRAIEKFDFDVVLMDVNMPLMDGLQTVALVREAERSSKKHQTIIFVTSHREYQDFCV